ncbi:MAG TPA: radical SAM protein [Thermoanaerobaculia bacterium]|nr:radical SAM protein [Thermoanaerobaculia bacterium]
MSAPCRPSLVSWNLTKRCNLRCPHCYLEAGKAAAAELSTGECLSLVGELRALGTEMLILTGGEPLLRKDVYAIARAASDAGMWVVMGTNGVLVTEAVADAMVECGIKGVAVSLDSTDPAKHDAFRGGRGAWQHTVRALGLCRSRGLEVLVQTTVLEENEEEVPALLELARELGAWSFNLYFLVRTGRGEGMTELPAARMEEILARLVALQEAYRPMLVRAKCAPHFKRIAYQAGEAGLESGGCMAGVDYCRITPEGDVTPCPYMTAVAGNVRHGGFTAIWRDAPLLQALRDPERLGGRCGACEFRDLCGGCRCRAYAATGDPLAEDPGCTWQPTGVPLPEMPLAWSDDARARLERIPIAFIRGKLERGIESFARRHGHRTVTLEVMDAGMQGAGRGPFGGGV